MLIIGLTGSLGTGKSTVAGMFKQKGAIILDADKVTHQLMQPRGRCFKSAVSAFGEGILTHGKIDRKKLGRIVFGKKAQLNRLTSIIHPEVIREINKTVAHLKRRKRAVLVIDAPLLIEAGIHRSVDLLVVVKANRGKQLARLKERTISRSEILKRIKAQQPIATKIKMADVVIDNRGNLNQTKTQVEEIWQRLIRRK